MTFGMGSSPRYRLFGDHEGGLGNLGRGTETDCLRALPRVEDRRRLRCRRRSLVAVDLPLTFFPLLLVLFFVLVFLLAILRLELVV